MTGCAPAQLLGGGPVYFDALLDTATRRAEAGYDTTELLAQLVEISFASYRVLLGLAGAKQIPTQYKVPRPGGESRAKPERVNWRVLAARVGGERHGRN